MRLGLTRAWKPRRAASFEERRLVEDELLDRVVDLCRRYRASAVTDQYSARSVVDRLRRAGVHCHIVSMTATTKTQAYAELRGRLYDGSLEIHNDAGLLQELRRLRTKFTAGSAQVVNPRVGSSHGDMAQALAIGTLEQARWRSTGGQPARGGGALFYDLRPGDF